MLFRPHTRSLAPPTSQRQLLAPPTGSTALPTRYPAPLLESLVLTSTPPVLTKSPGLQCSSILPRGLQLLSLGPQPCPQVSGSGPNSFLALSSHP